METTEAQHLREKLNEQHEQIEKLESAVIKAKSDCSTYQNMLKSYNTKDPDLKTQIITQFKSIFKTLNSAPLKH